MSVTGVFGAVIALFVLLLIIKDVFPRRICAICLAVGLIWLSLLIAYRSGRFDNPLLLGLLMGQSVTGLYYFLEKRVRKEWLVFRLPVLLTLTYIFYVLVAWNLPFGPLLLVVLLWVTGFGITAYRVPRINHLAKKLIECCGNW